MKVSIAMATYNGAKHLRAQLESIAAQSRLPDEMVVCDDCSTDGTVALLRAFAEEAQFIVRIVQNDKNLGYTKNFDKAISLCEGDVVFVSDQDDVWLPNKVEEVLPHFTSQRPFWVAINDQWVTDEDLVPTEETIFGNSRALGQSDRTFSAGSCSAMSRLFIRACFPSPVPEIPYDSWIHAVAVALESRTVVDLPLQYYRRHSSNASQPLVLRDYSSRWTLLFMEFGLAEMGAAFVREASLLRAVARIAEKLERGGVVGSDITKAAASRARTSADLIEERMMVNCLPRWRRLMPVLAVRRAYPADYRAASMFKDLLRRSASAA